MRHAEQISERGCVDLSAVALAKVEDQPQHVLGNMVRFPRLAFCTPALHIRLFL
jgi:hypothetical protein